MTTRFATLTSRMAIALTMIFAIAACGGGGGGGGGGFKGEAGADDPDTYYLTTELKDANGNPTSTVTNNSPGTLQVLVTRNGPNGRAVADVIVKASTDSGLLFPAEGSKLTNAEGLVTFRVEAGTGKGAGKIVVEVEDENGLIVDETINFQIGAASLRLGHLVNGEFFDAVIGIEPNGPIAAKGEAILSLAIVDENSLPVGSAESIRINSYCLDQGDASLSAANPVAVVDGQVELTYSAGSCVGADELTAELIGDGATAFGTVEIADPTADRLSFISADPTLIVLKGTGGGPNRLEQSKVTFQALDSVGTPQEGVPVSFALTTDVGGLSITPTSASTDADGFVTTNVISGDVATVVRVVASISKEDEDEVSAVSDVLTVSTGYPDQNSISLSVAGGFVVEEAMTVDGVTREISVRLADKFNNPVPDGTAAVFTTEYGSIESSCRTLGGVCTVTWTSQAPRVPTLEENQDLVVTIYDDNYSCPSHNGSNGPCPDDLGMIRGGRSTIVVRATGEESFIDSNANGIYDQGEKFANLTEAWIDHNENGFYDPATTSCNNNDEQLKCKAGSEELFNDLNSNGVFDANGDDPANGYPDEGVEAMYNGLLCPEEGDGNWCTRELLDVYDSEVLILSADPNWDIGLYQGRRPVTSGTRYGNTYVAYVSDLFNNIPTEGSSVSVEATAPCVATVLGNSIVPNTTAAGAFAVTFKQEGEVEYDSCTEDAPSGNDLIGDLKITLAPSKGGPPYTENWSCRATATDIKDGPCEEDGEDGEGGGGGGNSPVPGS